MNGRRRCSPVTLGTCTVGMCGPSLTTRSTAEFFATEAPALGSVATTTPLAAVPVRKVVGAHRQVLVLQVWVATLEVSPHHVGDVDVAPEDAEGAQQEEGDDGERHEQQDQQGDQAARALLAVLFLGPGGRRTGNACVRPVAAWMAWVAATAPIMEVTPGSPASTGRPSAKRSRSAQLLGRRVPGIGILGHGLHDHGLERDGHGWVGLTGQHGHVPHVLRSDGDR